MQKKLIALAVAGVMAAPLAAQAASAEVYGKVRVSVDAVSNDDQTVGNDDGKISVTSHSSRFGVKGSEDLDGGMKAVYQFEAEVDFDDDNNGIFDSMRDTYVGLAGDFGTVVAGRHDTPYKDATGKVEIFGDTHGDYNAIIGTTHDARADNVIAYISPDMSGFTLAAAYVTDLADDNLVDTTNNGGVEQSNEAISIAGMYSAGPLYAALAFQSLGEMGNAVGGGQPNEDAEGTKLVLGYNIGMTDLGFVYENDDMGGSNADQDRMYFSVKQDMGNGMDLKFAYGMADDRGNTANSGADFFALGVSKEMGDTTELYALYSALDNDGATANFNLDEVGAAGATEASASVLSVGVNLKFSSM